MSIELKDLLGMTMLSVEKDKDDREIIFTTSEKRVFKMFHSQDCCEDVYIESVAGDLEDLVGEPLLIAEEVCFINENPPNILIPEYQDSFTWTFYKLATRKGYVDVRWYGSSNGYYSEQVSLVEITH